MTPTNGAGLIAAVARPYDNVAAESAARSEQLQLSSYLTGIQQQRQQRNAVAASQWERSQQRLKSLPFLGVDRIKAKKYITEEIEKPVMQRLLKVYNGNIGQMMAAEPGAIEAAQAQFLSSDVYQTAERNREQVELARKAIADNQFLVGSGSGPADYRGGEKLLQDYMDGRADSFTFHGAYKPDDDLKPLREQYAKDRFPWEQVAVSEDEKLNFLVNTHGREVGLDKYLRQHAGRPAYYKVDPITEKSKFERDEGRFAMEQQRLKLAQSDHAQMTQLRGQQKQLNDLRIQEKQQELSGKAANGLPYDYDLLIKPTVQVKLASNDGGRRLPHSKLDVGKMRSLWGVSLSGDGGEHIAKQLGLAKQKGGYTKGRILEGFTDQNGVAAFNLKDSQFHVVAVDPTLYYDARDISTGGLNNKGVRGFGKVTVKFNSVRDAERAGLYDPNRLGMGLLGNEDPTGLFDSQTQAGAGVYNPATMEATFFTPMGHIDTRNNATFMRGVTNDAMGKSAANKAMPSVPYDDFRP